MTNKRTNVFIEATPLISDKMSGVGHVLLETIRALDTEENVKKYAIYTFLPWNERHKLERFGFKYIQLKTLPFHHKFFSLFARMSWSPPIDLFLGKGVYIFPNFRNWPLFLSPSITYIHDVCFAIEPNFVEERNLRFLQKYTQLWVKRTNLIGTVSESSKNEIIKYLGVAKDRIEVLPNAIDSTVFYPQPKTVVEAMRQKYNLGKKYVLYLGNIEPRKNLDTLVRAFSKSTMVSDTELFVIGGDGWRNDAIYEEIERAKDTGAKIKKNDHYVPDEDLPGLITGARLLVQPSWHEGFGLAVMQALACGTPVICSDIPSLHEVADIYKDKVTFFDPANDDELTKALNSNSWTSSGRSVPPGLPLWQDTGKKLLSIVDTLNKGGK